MSLSFWQEIESLAASTAETVVPALLNAYLSRTLDVPGAPAITLGNIGRIAGVVAAATVLQRLEGITQATATTPAAAPAPATTSAPAPAA
jgi:hypothetical protein